MEEQPRVVQLEILAGVAEDLLKDEPSPQEPEALQSNAAPLPTKLDATVKSLYDQIRNLGD